MFLSNSSEDYSLTSSNGGVVVRNVYFEWHNWVKL